MTGWRMGWMVLPKSLTESMGVLVEYNTSCAPDFIQSGAIAALNDGEASIAELRAELAAAKDQVVEALRTRCRASRRRSRRAACTHSSASTAMSTNSVEFAKTLIDKARVGLAPGSAFGPEGQGWLRWCFAARPETNAEGLARLARYLAPYLKSRTARPSRP